MTEGVRLQMQASEMSILKKMKGFMMFGKVRNIRFKNLSTSSCYKMPQERLPKQTLYAKK